MAAPTSIALDSCGIRISGGIQLLVGKWNTLEDDEIALNPVQI